MSKKMKQTIYIIFTGTTDYRQQLQEFLDTKVNGYTILDGKSAWTYDSIGAPPVTYKLDAQVILFFRYADALATKKFLNDECGQITVNIMTTKLKLFGVE